MKWLYGILRVALALLLMVPVLALPYYFALSAGSLYAVLHEEAYQKIHPDIVDPANEGRRVQFTAPAYTDEWLELRDIGVRCQALRLELRNSVYSRETSYMGLPLRSRCNFARNVRVGAFSMCFKDEHMAGRGGEQAIPRELLNLPESWRPYCRVELDESHEKPYYLNLEFDGDPARKMHCCMTANGSVVTVRGVQRGREIKPVHGVARDDVFFSHTDEYNRGRKRDDAVLALMVTLILPALLVGVFRLVYWQKGAKSTSLVICLMILLDAGACLCFSGVVDGVWLGVAGMLAVLSVWQIVRIVRAFGVDGKSE